MAHANPDFSDAEVGDKVYYRGLDEWLEGVVIQNRSDCRQIDVGFSEDGGSPYAFTVSAGYDGMIDYVRNGHIPALYWRPLPNPPPDCLKSPRRMVRE
jgi:hypothetical protein